MSSFLYSEYLEKLEQLQAHERKVATPPFFMMIMGAFALHLLFLGIYGMDRKEVVEVPVRALSLHLGGGGLKLVKGEVAAVKATNTPPLEANKKNLVTPDVKALIGKGVEVENKKITPPQPVTTSQPEKVEPVVTSENNVQASGVGAGVGAAAAGEASARYTQTLSQWIVRRRIYPILSQNKGEEGWVILRVRINRKGQIKKLAIDKSSGYPLLDAAAIESAKRANPLPAVPRSYPDDSELLEFQLPVEFRLVK